MAIRTLTPEELHRAEMREISDSCFNRALTFFGEENYLAALRSITDSFSHVDKEVAANRITFALLLVPKALDQESVKLGLHTRAKRAAVISHYLVNILYDTHSLDLPRELRRRLGVKILQLHKEFDDGRNEDAKRQRKNLFEIMPSFVRTKRCLNPRLERRTKHRLG